MIRGAKAGLQVGAAEEVAEEVATGAGLEVEADLTGPIALLTREHTLFRNLIVQPRQKLTVTAQFSQEQVRLSFSEGLDPPSFYLCVSGTALYWISLGRQY